MSRVLECPYCEYTLTAEKIEQYGRDTLCPYCERGTLAKYGLRVPAALSLNHGGPGICTLCYPNGAPKPLAPQQQGELLL